MDELLNTEVVQCVNYRSNLDQNKMGIGNFVNGAYPVVYNVKIFLIVICVILNGCNSLC